MLCRNSFFLTRLISAVDMRVTPSLPQRGRQPKGSIPLDPHFRGIFINLLRDYHIFGDALAAGAEARCAGAPKSDFRGKCISFS